MTVCGACLGIGYAPCPTCEGEGSVDIDTGPELCPECVGRGDSICLVCVGQGVDEGDRE